MDRFSEWPLPFAPKRHIPGKNELSSIFLVNYGDDGFNHLLWMHFSIFLSIIRPLVPIFSNQNWPCAPGDKSLTTLRTKFPHDQFDFRHPTTNYVRKNRSKIIDPSFRFKVASKIRGIIRTRKKHESVLQNVLTSFPEYEVLPFPSPLWISSRKQAKLFVTANSLIYTHSPIPRYRDRSEMTDFLSRVDNEQNDSMTILKF